MTRDQRCLTIGVRQPVFLTVLGRGLITALNGPEGMMSNPAGRASVADVVCKWSRHLPHSPLPLPRPLLRESELRLPLQLPLVINCCCCSSSSSSSSSSPSSSSNVWHNGLLATRVSAHCRTSPVTSLCHTLVTALGGIRFFLHRNRLLLTSPSLL